MQGAVFGAGQVTRSVSEGMLYHPRLRFGLPLIPPALSTSRMALRRFRLDESRSVGRAVRDNVDDGEGIAADVRIFPFHFQVAQVHESFAVTRNEQWFLR
jgi:hypothetical protein